MATRRRQHPSGVKIVAWVSHHHHHHHHHHHGWWATWSGPMGQPTTVNVGHTVTCTYIIVDQNGNPMLTQPPLVSAAAWTDTPSAAGVDNSSVSADGTTDVISALAAGSDTVGVNVVVAVNGQNMTFTDSILITISPAPQVPSGVQIQSSVQ